MKDQNAFSIGYKAAICTFSAIHGNIFEEKDAAFANVGLWRSTGFCVGFSYSSLLCTAVKLYVQCVVLSLGALGYFFVEYIVRKEKNKIQPTQERKVGVFHLNDKWNTGQ